ncbi:hypothetical protein J4734_28325 [Klebsiella pneumoniae]|uniref:Uncharacterized protein n=1 Tax=Klebsiella pneumoniae TaxID=573 RepID=A0A939SUT7_KLEPN|nr:hypothetical protein [Klebsiella pneumoniae]
MKTGDRQLSAREAGIHPSLWPRQGYGDGFLRRWSRCAIFWRAIGWKAKQDGFAGGTVLGTLSVNGKG